MAPLANSPLFDSRTQAIFFVIFLSTTGLPVEGECIAVCDGRNILNQVLFKFKLLLLPLAQSVDIPVLEREREPESES